MLGLKLKFNWRSLSLILVKGAFVSLLLGLFARYERISDDHMILNGLPVAFVIQAIDIRTGSYLSISIDYLGFIINTIFWATIVQIINSFLGSLQGKMRRAG